MKYTSLIVFSLLISSESYAQTKCIPPEGGKCLTADQYSQVKQALNELKSIHESPMSFKTTESIVIVQDWDGRMYVNGGSTNPLKIDVTIGEYIDRELVINLPTKIYYRPKPIDPMFRLRIRAQTGILLPQVVDSSKFLDAGIGWDFFHIGSFNTSVYTGIRSCGGGIGFDLTKNFGLYGGYSLIYEELKSNVLAGVYFSFN